MRKLLLIGVGVVGVALCVKHCARACRELEVRAR